MKVILRTSDGCGVARRSESEQQSGRIFKLAGQMFACASHTRARLPPDIDQTVRIVLYSLIFLLSVLGNSLIITVLVRNRRMRTVTNLFLLSLSVSDLMVSIVCIPFTLIPNLMRNFIFGTGICKLVMYFMGESGWFDL